MTILCVNNLWDSRAKPWTTPFYILGVKITKCPTNGDLQRVDTWMWSYVRLTLNDAKQPIVSKHSDLGTCWARYPSGPSKEDSPLWNPEVSLLHARAQSLERASLWRGRSSYVSTASKHLLEFSSTFRPSSMKWGGITLPSLVTATKTITEAGFLLCKRWILII